MLRQSLLLAFRIYRKNPFLSTAVIVTLALGIGANTAIFNIVNGVLLKPLPYPEGERLVYVKQTYESLRSSPNPRLQAIWNQIPVSYLNTLDWRAQSRTLESIGLYREHSVTFQGNGEPLAVDAAEVDVDLFTTLGVQPVLGRTFSTEEVEQRERLVILGHDLWQSRWAGSSDVLGQILHLNGEPHTVVGVMPAGFEIAGRTRDRLWTPLRVEDKDLQMRNNQRLYGIARLAEGVGLSDAQQELDHLAGAQAEAWPETNEGAGVNLEGVLDSLVGESRSLLFILMAAVVMVLAVACVNVSHLLLVQTHRRQGELSIRVALGAGRRDLARQLLSEGLFLAGAGGALGLLLAVVGQDLLLAWIPADLPRTTELAMDGRVLGFTLGISLLVALICGVVPSMLGLGSAPADPLRSGRRAGQSRASARLYGALVVAEIALTLMLTAGAGLLVNSFVRLSSVEPGFRTDGLLVQDLRLPAWAYPDEIRRQEFAERLTTRLQGSPGVQAVALTSKLPFAGPALVAGFQIPGAEQTSEDWTQGHSASLKFVSPGYFDTMGIPVRQGRAFQGSDRPESGRTVVMNETLAALCWPDGHAVGREIQFSEKTYSVIGVVADIRHDGLADDTGALMYFPWSQRGDLAALADVLTVVVKVDGEPLALAPVVHGVVRELDPALPLSAATSVDELMHGSLGAPRSRTSLVLLLAGLALVLALVGTYGMVSFSVSRRVQEIGVRMALGASTTQVRRAVIRQTLTLAAMGIALGLVGALLGGRWLEGQLWGVQARDPLTLFLATAVLALTAYVAGWLPARRASRVDPMTALRTD